jgi:cytochrome b involved in lipid metabolism
MEGRIMQYIRQLFPSLIIPKPAWIQAIHWAHGVHNWLPMVDSNTIYDQIQNPFENIFICGEAYSRWQEWMEGALETASEAASKSVVSKTKTKLKLTLTQVKNHKNKSLTVIHGRIYDLSKMDWIHRHPGGDVIKKAIGKDATHMFEYISHPDYVMNILEDMYVGDLQQ